MKALLFALQHPPRIPAVGDTSPLAGLSRRRLGVIDVVAQSVAAMAPTAGVATMPALVAAVAGPGTALSVLLATILVVLISSTISQFARRLAVTGSLYSYTAQAFGPYPALLTGASLLLGYSFITMVALVGAGIFSADLAGRLWPVVGSGALPVVAGTTVVTAFCFAVMRKGLRVASLATLVIECASVVLVLVLAGVLLAQQGLPQIARFNLSGATPAGVAGGTVLALTAFVGFESATALGAETRSPLKTLPRALLWTVLATGLFFLLATYAQLSGFGWRDQELAGSASPFADLATQAGLVGMFHALDIAITLSFVACALASITALARVLFTMGREGVVPNWLGEAHSTSGVPIRAVSLVLPVTASVPLVFLFGGITPWEVMSTLIVASSAGFVTSYILLGIALPLFLRRIAEVTALPVVVALSTAVLLTAALLVYLHGAVLNSRGAGVVLFLSALGALSLWFLLKHRYGRGHGPGPGIYDVPTTGDLLGAGRAE